jgi:hypothetical protein
MKKEVFKKVEVSAFVEAVDVIQTEEVKSAVSDFDSDTDMENLQSVDEILLKNLLSRRVQFENPRP